MSNAELADRLESLAAAWGPRPAGKATILEAAAALRAYVNGDAALAMIHDLMQLYVSACGQGDSIGEAKANARSADHMMAKALTAYGFTAEQTAAAWKRFHAQSSISSQRLGE